MFNPKHEYLTVAEFLTRYRQKLSLWSYMGRDNNAGRYREWYVAVEGITEKRFFVFDRRD
jgi:hypothetical protein